MVGVCQISLHLPNVSSLKSKRKIIKSLKDRIRSKFNVSVAEMDAHDKWQSAVIGIAYICNQRNRVDQILSTIVNLIENSYDVLITDYSIEIL